MKIEDESALTTMRMHIEVLHNQSSDHRDKIAALEFEADQLRKKARSDSSIIYGFIFGLFLLVIIL